MALRDIGARRGADETLNHQIVDTFATVAEPDLSWTEKIWTSIAGTDGSLQLDFGIGKYHMESIISGVWPELGLSAESDHRVAYG